MRVPATIVDQLFSKSNDKDLGGIYTIQPETLSVRITHFGSTGGFAQSRYGGFPIDHCFHFADTHDGSYALYQSAKGDDAAVELDVIPDPLRRLFSRFGIDLGDLPVEE